MMDNITITIIGMLVQCPDLDSFTTDNDDDDNNDGTSDELPLSSSLPLLPHLIPENF